MWIKIQRDQMNDAFGNRSVKQKHQLMKHPFGQTPDEHRRKEKFEHTGPKFHL